MESMDINEPSERHPLHSEWVVWYHNPSDQTWTQESYKDILELACIEDFLVLRNSWNQCLPLVHEGMFFMMRKKNGHAILPLWEDPENTNGGVWSFKINKEDAESIWFKLCMYMIGETICSDTNMAMTVNGISISPKKNFCIVKIWNNDCANNQTSIISNELSFLNPTDALYTNHTNNLEREQQKIKFNSQFGEKRWDGVRSGGGHRDRYGGNGGGDRYGGDRGDRGDRPERDYGRQRYDRGDRGERSDRYGGNGGSDRYGGNGGGDRYGGNGGGDREHGNRERGSRDYNRERPQRSDRFPPPERVN